MRVRVRAYLYHTGGRTAIMKQSWLFFRLNVSPLGVQDDHVSLNVLSSTY